MSDLDEKKPTGKAGKRKRNAEQRSRKSDQNRGPKADQQRPVKAQVGPLMVASNDAARIDATTAAAQPFTTVTATEPLAVAGQAFEAQADSTITAADIVEVIAQDAGEPPAVLMSSIDTESVAMRAVEQQASPMAASADLLPVATFDVREPSAALTIVETAPIATPGVKQQTVVSIPPEVVSEVVTAAVADVPVSLQTIATAYGDYTRKSLEQTRCFFDRLTGVRTLDQAVEVQTEFARQACETFVAEAQKIQDLHRELARQRFERFEGLMSLGTQTSRFM